VLPTYELDDDLIAAVQAGGQARARAIRCPLRALVLGRGSRPEIELVLDAVQADAVPVLRRAGGGCAVLIDPGNLILSLVLPLPGLGRSKEAFAAISSWIAGGLAALGVSGVAQRGHSDLTLGERKVGGACIHRSRDLLYYSTTLLLTPDVAGMQRYLRHPPREPDYRRGRSHRDFVGAIPGLGDDGTVVARRLAQVLDRTELLGHAIQLQPAPAGRASPLAPC
jgi:lipoate-protein ligase A